MKKIITALATALMLTACTPDETHEYVLTYKIYYPGNTVTKTYTFEGIKYTTYSSRCSNHLQVTQGNNLFTRRYITIEETTAPIQVISFKRK